MNCAVCQQELASDVTVELERCGHSIHVACAMRWFRSAKAQGRCPVCNGAPASNDEDEDERSAEGELDESDDSDSSDDGRNAEVERMLEGLVSKMEAQETQMKAQQERWERRVDELTETRSQLETKLATKDEEIARLKRELAAASEHSAANERAEAAEAEVARLEQQLNRKFKPGKWHKHADGGKGAGLCEECGKIVRDDHGENLTSHTFYNWNNRCRDCPDGGPGAQTKRKERERLEGERLERERLVATASAAERARLELAHREAQS